MSTNTLNAKHTGHFGTKARTPKAGFFAAIGNTLLTWQDRASMRYQLADLDKEILNDMGLNEQAVSKEISKPFWIA